MLISNPEVEEGYSTFEKLISDRIFNNTQPLFTTNVDLAALWGHYLTNLPEERRQHYNCHCCRKFIESFGSLVTIDAAGKTKAFLWNSLEVPVFFKSAVEAMAQLVESAKVTGVFLSKTPVWGNLVTEDKKRNCSWTHLSGRPSVVFSHQVLTAFQAMAQKREDYQILLRGLADYKQSVVAEAVRVLKSEALTRSEKALGIAEWFHDLFGKNSNQIWLSVATAPPGFCHVRNTVISTLLDDIVLGLSFEDVSRKWSEKMHPLQYQRPTAAPTEGAIAAAEKLVETLGVAKALERRFATLEDVLEKLWMPEVISEPEESPDQEGVFSHLKKQVEAVKQLQLPAKTVTWEKFSQSVLKDAKKLEVLLPANGSFYGLLTATHPDAPPILQWDGLEGHARNPVSWYFYVTGSRPAQWNLKAGEWGLVKAVFLPPHQWQERDKFKHQGDNIFLAIEGCHESENAVIQLCLFPEILKAEFHGIRSVIEAHSQKKGVSHPELGTANGLAFQKNGLLPLTLKVNGKDSYLIDRWE